jgi:hypothetical protein
LTKNWHHTDRLDNHEERGPSRITGLFSDVHRPSAQRCCNHRRRRHVIMEKKLEFFCFFNISLNLTFCSDRLIIFLFGSSINRIRLCTNYNLFFEKNSVYRQINLTRVEFIIYIELDVFLLKLSFVFVKNTIKKIKFKKFQKIKQRRLSSRDNRHVKRENNVMIGGSDYY